MMAFLGAVFHFPDARQIPSSIRSRLPDRLVSGAYAQEKITRGFFAAHLQAGELRLLLSKLQSLRLVAWIFVILRIMRVLNESCPIESNRVPSRTVKVDS